MSPEEDKSLRLDQLWRAESWTMWVIVSSWRLRGYCRRKWPSWNQVALSIPLRSPARLASPRSLSFSFSILFSLSSPPLPSALLAPLNPSFHLAFPSFVHPSVFSFPPFLDYSSLLWYFLDRTWKGAHEETTKFVIPRLCSSLSSLSYIFHSINNICGHSNILVVS